MLKNDQTVVIESNKDINCGTWKAINQFKNNTTKAGGGPIVGLLLTCQKHLQSKKNIKHRMKFAYVINTGQLQNASITNPKFYI